ncbi:MAG: hypothetical protein H7X91_11970 [Burkholderiales bacterium]|nr:hypothetical protein [Burkholderiales bacterium]
MDYAERCSGETMTQKLFIAALLSAALISPICTAAEMGPTSAPLGRLFFSPNQRAELDRVRHAPPVSPPKPAIQVVAKALAPPPLLTPEIVTVNGIVQRSDGQSTVWINDQPVTEHEAEGQASVKPIGAGAATVVLPKSGRMEVKVGQSLNFRTGEISERYKGSTNEDPSNRLNDVTRGPTNNAASRGTANSSFTSGRAQ